MKFPDPPRGIRALLWRMPIWIYRLGQGWMMGNKLLLLTHIGRKSGQERQAVVEIINSDPQEGIYYSVSGFGIQAQWYQNIIQEPAVKIQVGNKRMTATAKQLNPQQASQMILDYAQKNPKNLQVLGNLMGYEIDHSPDGYLAFGKEIPVIQFRVQPTKD